MELLRTENIEKRFTNYLALDDVSINVRQGRIFGLLGPNGAGKTTLIRIINRITAPDKGMLYFDERPMVSDDIYNIGYLPEERGLYKKMKVGEQAMYLARLKGLSKPEAIKQLKMWFIKFGIQAWWDKKVEELSKGMAQKVQFIVTILHKPKLLIFDEPFSGFDPVNAQLIKNEILELRDSGSTIIFSTHNMASVEELCDDIVLINKSKNILSGELHQIRYQYGDNIYEVGFKGDIEQLKQSLTPDYELKGQTVEKTIPVVRIKAQQKHSDNKLLSLLLPVVEIVHFNEVIPSMNDIFIKMVGSDDSLSRE
ncbi:MAG: ATP-binding cassette domain-containing protein [Prevotellaceae bacterium]|jgi:ABC-2 type transport system ATP-binding protein|nr:ATP-binding cassette domain-containing protein [Prevotellaceae bacterium]